MNTREQMQDGMAEALRLTREGRLGEATAAIQRALGGAPNRPVGEDNRVVDEAPQTTTPPRENKTEKHTLRPAPRPPRGHRTAPRPPVDLPNLPPDGFSVEMPFRMPGTGQGSGAPPVAPGRFVERSFANKAGTRAYKLYIPSGYTGQEEVPLVVMLHGCTQSPDDFAAGTHMNALAEERTFLVAYPQQDGRANMSRCWNWFERADQGRGRGEPSIIAGITCEVIGEHNVDAEKVYVAGMSAGGAMAAILGEAYPDLYAAVGVHSGLPPGAAHDLSSAFAAMQGRGAEQPAVAANAGESARSLPMILFHGDRDTTVNPRNADHLLAHGPAGSIRRSAPDGQAPRVATRRGQVPEGHAYTRATYRDAGGRDIAERWTVHGLGHNWSGGSAPGSYTDPKGPDASAEMVRFFLQHRRREPAERSDG